MKHTLICIIFLIGSIAGALTGSLVSEELVYKVPAKYLTFGRARETQTASKIYNGRAPENGKILYIMGGSGAYASGNEHSLSEKLTQRLGVPVEVFILATANQIIPESYAMIEKLPKSSIQDQAYVLMTYSGHRTIAHPAKSLAGALRRKRILLRYDALRNLFKNDDLFDEPFMVIEENSMADPELQTLMSDPEIILATIDKDYTSSVGSHWMKYFILDKMKKLSRKRIPNNIFEDKDVFSKNEYSEANLKRTKNAFKNPKVRSRYERGHKKFFDVLLQRTSLIPDEHIQHRQDFALYFIEKSKLAADHKNYKFATLELPLHSSIYDEPIIETYRTKFGEKLRTVSHDSGFSNFYLSGPVDELSPFDHWYDTGHMSPIGRYIFEDYYVDALVSFMTDNEGGLYTENNMAADEKESDPLKGKN